MKATSFTGYYIDGDRERIPYEADAYINQLGHYCVDHEYGMARRSLEYLVKHPTWPVEWQQHIPMFAWEEYLYTGNADFLRQNYDLLATKTLRSLAREDGLLKIGKNAPKDLLASLGIDQLKILVDWPVGERDGHKMTEVDSVVNAFYYNDLVIMAKIAKALGKPVDAKKFESAASAAFAKYQEVFFVPAKGIYRDGEGADHSSIHANLFPLAFGLVPPEKAKPVIEFVKSRGMACSVYAAQYLLEGLYRNGAGEEALKLLTSTGKRSWVNMINAGSTITMEAWDDSFKRNQDWNHAWGAAPANLIPRGLMGIQPIEPGYKRALIHPQIGSLESAAIKVPTVLGPIEMSIGKAGAGRQLKLQLPAGMSGELVLPGSTKPIEVKPDGKAVSVAFPL